MGLTSWLRTRLGNRAPKAQHRPVATRFRPQLEPLEDRWLPSTLTVTNNLDSGPGSLRAEIAAAHNNDKIVFAPSLDDQTITLTSGSLDIHKVKNLTIQGPGAGHLTVSGSRSATVFLIEANATNITLSGLTISGGQGNAGNPYYVNQGDGGGIYNAGTLTVSGCTLTDNHGSAGGFPSALGGGIYNVGMLTVTGSTLSGNTGSYGAGIYNALGATLTVSGCTLSGNRADYTGAGGAIYNAGTLTVSDSVFSLNYPGNIYGSYTDGGGNTFG